MHFSTKVDYQYRDAGNYKFGGEFYVSGLLQLKMLEPYMFMREWFIPEIAGIPSLVPELKNDDDHLLHEFCSFESLGNTQVLCTAKELLDRFKKASQKDWFGALPDRYRHYSILAR